MSLGKNVGFEKKKLMRKAERNEPEPVSPPAIAAPKPQPEVSAKPVETPPAAPVVIATAAKTPTTTAFFEARSYLIFQHEHSLYGVDAGVVKEIFRLPELTPLDESPDYLAGVVNLRGRIAPIIDLDLRLGHEPGRYQLSHSVIVVELETGQLVGLIVQEMKDVQVVTQKDVERVTFYTERAARASHLVMYEAKIGDDIIMLLDHNLLILPDDQEDLLQTEGAPRLATMGEADKEKPRDGKRKRRIFCPDALPEERQVFKERARSLMVVVDSSDLSGLIAMSVIGLNSEYFGIDLELVREFANIRDVMPIPCCPDHIIGNMNLRGDILTLVDIRKALKMPIDKSSDVGKVIVVQANNLQVGVYADDVYDVIYVNSAEIGKVPAAVHSISEEYLKGTAPYANRMLGILDLQKILSKDELVINEEV